MATETHAERRAIVVLGMHRSGTSALARVLSLAGAALPATLMEPGADNPVGFWESRMIADFNDEVLRGLDTGWDDAFGPRRRNDRPLPIGRFVPQARDLLRSEFEGASICVLKEPRISLLLDLWQAALEQEQIQPHYVIIIRRPDEVARSLAVRNKIQKSRALLLWATYMVSAEMRTRDRSRVFVDFDTMMRDPESLLERLESTFGLQFPRITRVALSEIEEFLDPELKHHNESGKLKLPPPLRQLGSLYDFLRAAAEGEPQNYDVPTQVAAWLRSLDDTVGPLLAESRRSLLDTRKVFEDRERSLDGELSRQRSDADAARSQLSEALALADELQRQLEEERNSAAERAAEQDLRAVELDAKVEALAAQASAAELALRNELARVQAEAESERQQKDMLRTWGEALQRQAEDSDTQLRRVQQLAEEASARGIALQSEVDRLLAEREATRSALQEAEDQFRQLQTASQETEAQLREAQATSEERDAQFAQLRAAHDEMEAQFRQLLASSKEADAELQQLRAATEQADAALQATMSRLSEAQAEADRTAQMMRAQLEATQTQASETVAAARREATVSKEREELASRQAAALEDALALIEQSGTWRLAQRLRAMKRWLPLRG